MSSFCANRVTLCFSVAPFPMINVWGQVLLKAHSLLWACCPAAKYNAMNHSSVKPQGHRRLDISLGLVISFL